MNNEDYIELLKELYQNNLPDERTLQLPNYIVNQFSSEVFFSDYKCYKIQTQSEIFVLKITNITELQIISILNKHNFSSPKLLKVLENKATGEVAVFMNFIDGKEVANSKNKADWIKVAQTIGEFQLLMSNIKSSINYDKLCYQNYENKYNVLSINSDLSIMYIDVINIIKERIKVCPKVISHGDSFPTNFLVNEDVITMIDFATSLRLPYYHDIARLTSMPLLNGEDLICPYVDEVIEAYYDVVGIKFNISKDDFIKDIYIGSFIELFYYCINEHDKKSNFYIFSNQLLQKFSTKILN
ncbi:hypothetical protein D3C73_745550 [compost metagenome]